jgi:SAM-dependent methyltransferase
MSQNAYLDIVAHYENCLEKHGDCHKGVDWPNPVDADIRYQIMLDLVPNDESCSLLDFGCGTALLQGFINKNKTCYEHIEYSGLDISTKFIDVCRQKYPDVGFWHVDILKDKDSLPEFDYIVLNGVFTEKVSLSFEEMEFYFQTMIRTVYGKARKGIAFNVMSKAVDWERDDLFHLSADRLISFLVNNISRHFVIRNDYGLYEYTTYVYKSASVWRGK